MPQDFLCATSPDNFQKAINGPPWQQDSSDVINYPQRNKINMNVGVHLSVFTTPIKMWGLGCHDVESTVSLRNLWYNFRKQNFISYCENSVAEASLQTVPGRAPQPLQQDLQSDFRQCQRPQHTQHDVSNNLIVFSIAMVYLQGQCRPPSLLFLTAACSVSLPFLLTQRCLLRKLNPKK